MRSWPRSSGFRHDIEPGMLTLIADYTPPHALHTDGANARQRAGKNLNGCGVLRVPLACGRSGRSDRGADVSFKKSSHPVGLMNCGAGTVSFCRPSTPHGSRCSCGGTGRGVRRTESTRRLQKWPRARGAPYAPARHWAATTSSRAPSQVRPGCRLQRRRRGHSARRTRRLRPCRRRFRAAS